LITFGGLQTFFSDDGIIVLCVCEAGQNDATLLKFSRIVGVPVYATTGDVSPNMSFSNFGWWWGPTVAAFPDGTFARGMSVRIPVDPWEGPQS